MDLFDVVRSCIRRWYVVLPLLLIAGWASYHVYSGAKVLYYSNAVVGIAPPNTQTLQSLDGSPVPRNGLLDAGGPLLIANIATLSLRDPGAVGAVVAFGGKPNYTTKMFAAGDGTQSLPFIMIEAEEPDADDAARTVGAVVQNVDPLLKTLQQQAGVPDDQMAKSLVVSPTSEPVAGTSSRMKATLAILLSGVALTILVAVVVDVLIVRLKASREGRQRAEKQTIPARGPQANEALADERADQEFDPWGERSIKHTASASRADTSSR